MSDEIIDDLGPENDNQHTDNRIEINHGGIKTKGILSIPLSFTTGIWGLIIANQALNEAKEAEEIISKNPEAYDERVMNDLKVGKNCARISLFGVLVMIATLLIYMSI